MAACKQIGTVLRYFRYTPQFSGTWTCNEPQMNVRTQMVLGTQKRNVHLSASKSDLMEFFDDKKNWGELEVKVGRSWKVEELRIKSNTDLHKLWYILLKERNMLLTMEHEHKEKGESFPNPERLDKVDISMENLESVVRERNRAYYELETGETGERPSGTAVNCFGLDYNYKKSEHVMEEKFNTTYQKEVKLYRHTEDKEYVDEFVKLYREKWYRKHKQQRKSDFNHVVQLLKRFPDMDMNALAKQYPKVDINMAKQRRAARGNRVNEWT